MGGQNQMRLFRDAQLCGQIVAAGGQRFGLFTEKDGVEHHPVTDDIGLTSLKDTRRDRAEYVFFAVELQRMPCIGTALKACHDFVGGGQYVDDLAFAFVAPLQTQDDIDFLHCI